MSHKPSFFAELRRRHIFRIAAAYAVTAWLLIQLAAIALPTFNAPDWVLKVVIGLLLLFFPVALILAWAFEVTPEGVRRTVAVDDADARGSEMRRRVGRALNFSIIVVLAAAVGILGWQWVDTVAGRKTQPMPSETASSSALATAANAGSSATTISAKSIAVLPFENLSSDKSNAYFAAGMQDLILTRLADIGDLKVMSRTATARYASHPDDLPAIGQRLHVATFLEGSVQKAGNQVLINVQLINARTGTHLWAAAYTRTLHDIFGVEGEVAQKIAAALDSELSPAEATAVAKVPTRNPEAYDAYLRAEHYLHQASDESAYTTLLPKAIAAYLKAVKLDPEFALAWADLAKAQMTEVDWGVAQDDVQTVVQEALRNADHALKLSPDLPEGHFATALVDLVGLHDDGDARSQLKRSLRLRPNYAEAMRTLAITDALYGNDIAQGVKEVERALELDPRNSHTALIVGDARMAQGDYAGARRVLRHALAISPDKANVYRALSQAVLFQTGDINAALKVLDSIPDDAPRRSDLDADRVELLLMQKNIDAARRVARHLHIGYSAGRILDVYLRGDVEWTAGAEDKARPYLQEADRMLQARLADTPDDTQLLRLRARVLIRLGRRQDAANQVRIALRIDRQPGHPSNLIRADLDTQARIQAIVGDYPAAITTLQKLMGDHGGLFESPAVLRVDPVWNPLRRYPRFQALIASTSAAGSGGEQGPAGQ
ncbi:MAG: tetratricopeptide repeat protein [Gammaproteobacteria bacterium]|jgi:TolB-like protein/predicted Zn-dependent protease